jgi:para-aminobenzoate synthetase / 4-amino-4-deoxychorismate lyase
VILWHRAGEVTEGTATGIVADVGARLLTPPVSGGLLAGHLPAQLLASGTVSERPIRVAELNDARRGWW